MGPEAAFRGLVVRSRVDRKLPLHRLVVTPDEVRVWVLVDGTLRVARADLTRIELTRQFPLGLRVVAFRTAHRSLMFAPLRARRLLAALREHGWPLPPP
ncbi:MAG TPA: hypothetical protein VNA20_07710 [Frankiaceae bacterium]|nr:hypothetical protein [Frankiaceae bacterium]